ncbi:MAG: Uma2 family endonuclease [Acidobacteriota bacterium]
MSLPESKLATWVDVVGLPEGLRTEILDGQVITAPRPSTDHAHIQTGLSGFIGHPFGFDERPGGWWILPEVDIELGPHDVVEPDLAGWRRERVPHFPRERPVRIRPDWICEILSTTNRRHDLITKANLYLRVGVPFYWIVDPDGRTLQAFKLVGAPGEAAWLLLGTWSDGDCLGIPPFEAVALGVGRLFPPRQ